MTSILEQFEQESQHSKKKVASSSVSELYNILSLKYDEDNEYLPIFTVSKLKTMPAITKRLQFLAVGGELIAFLTNSNLLYVFNSKSLDTPKEIDINKFLGYPCKINNLFMEPLGGYYILLSITAVSNANSSPIASNPNYSLYYVNAMVSTLKLKQIDKMRNHNVTAVAWNRLRMTTQYTAPILMGTSKGLIFEIKWNLESEKLLSLSGDSICKEVFDIGKNRSGAGITGLEFFRFLNEPDKYFVIATTVDRLYQFVGSINCNDERSVLSQIFDDYLKVPETFIEISHSSNSSESKVFFLKTFDEECNISVIPKSLGWHISGIGVIYRQLQLEWRKGLTEVCIQNHVLDYKPLSPPAVTFLLTQFHLLLLYPDKIVGVSVLNKEMVFIEFCDESYGKYINMCQDMDGNVWLLSERAIHKGEFYKEDRFVWKIYLDMKMFSLAKEYCHSNIDNLRQVMIKESEYYFDHEMYEESASLYSQIEGISFEEVALKFLRSGKIEALKLYLMKTLVKLKIQESAHITMITFWLMEIFIKQLADAKFVDGLAERYRKLQKDFETLLLLPHVDSCIRTNKEVAYKILNSYGDTENLIKLAIVLKDHEKIVWHYLEEGKVHTALNIIKDNPESFVQKSLICSFMPKFISLEPKDTIDVLKKLGRNLEPIAVLPSLIFPYHNDVQAIEVIRYLEYCIHSLHSHEQPIHNYLITLYAKYKPEKVMQYLATQGQDKLEVNYEIRYALKICQEYGLNEPCVQLFVLLGLWESAVDLALSVDIELAKRTVPQLSYHNTELCKKLWLKIAQHVVNECNDIERAMELLQQCDLIKIEDVLPFFDDFVTIDHFKEAICTSLQEYNQNIEMLKEEMDDATKSADEIRADIQAFRNRYSVIQSSDLCCSCDIQLLMRPFYVFPCSHNFHVDCLIMELKPYLSEYNINRIRSLQHQLLELSPSTNSDDLVSLNSNSFHLKEQLKNELDSIIATECFFCGSLTIEQIDRPFIENDEFERIRADWE